MEKNACPQGIVHRVHREGERISHTVRVRPAAMMYEILRDFCHWRHILSQVIQFEENPAENYVNILKSRVVILRIIPIPKYSLPSNRNSTTMNDRLKK